MTSLWCIHGNLQLPSVWNLFDNRFSLAESKNRLPVHTVNLWKNNSTDFNEWASLFCRQIRDDTDDAPQLLMGYSLGGRLAWHAILEDPMLWRGAIIIAAHPGLADPRGREKRLQQDQTWATRFRAEPWDDLMRDWDSRPVFAGISSPTSRKEHDFDREKIAFLFDTFSTGRQEPLMDKLQKLQKPPILFISGHHDEKYCEIGQELARAIPVVRHVVIERAGHRVPWDNSDEFVHAVQHFIDRRDPLPRHLLWS